MTSYPSSRPIAGLPQYHSQGQRTSTVVAPVSAPRQPIQSPYNPHPGELQAGARNRLWLALRSGLDSEVDWSLPRLILASFDQPELFKLEIWPDSVNALLVAPVAWLEEMEKEATLMELRKEKLANAGAGASERNGDVRGQMILGIVSDWTRNVELETRAINSLLVLRNASLTSNNARTISKPNFVDFLIRLFSLPADFLLELSLRQPEILQHVFVLVQSTFPYLAPPPHQSKSNGDAAQTTLSTESKTEKKLLSALSRTMTTIIVETRDAGVLHNLLPILISAFQLPNIPLPPPDLIPYLLKTLTLGNPPPLLDLSIDLLISLTQNSTNSRSILADPLFPAHLRNMVILLEHSERKTSAAWDAPAQYHGMIVPNPASSSGLVEQASKRRKVEREAAQRIMESGNPMGVIVDVGTRPPTMSISTKTKLFAMKEPARSIHWMHENFVYCSNSTILQVRFWHAYRDFFSALPTSDQMLSASEVIKNVTVAFPCASAKVVQESDGPKFVIWGLGWRKASDDTQRFSCSWNECPNPQGHPDAIRLLDHVRETHLPQATQCAWSTCRHSPLTLSHICTHLPITNAVSIPDQVTIHPSMSMYDRPFSNVTQRPPPPLSRNYKLHFMGSVTPTDARRNPIGVAYLTSLLLRNLARTLRADLTSATPADADLSQEAKNERKKHLREERFGLPIPDTVLREEEEEENANAGPNGLGGGDVLIGEMNKEQREKARLAFDAVEPRVLAVVEGNMSGLSHYLGECFGFGVLGGW